MSGLCSSLRIPERLHTNNREIDNDFRGEEIYRRFNISGERSNWENNRTLSASIFPVDRDSCNRQKFSLSPNDVLYNTRPQDNGAHYLHHGIIMFKAEAVEEFDETLTENGKNRIFKLRIEHVPTECMYPHCEVHVFENGVKLDLTKPPRSIRGFVRDVLLEHSSIIKYPDSNSQS